MFSSSLSDTESDLSEVADDLASDASGADDQEEPDREFDYVAAGLQFYGMQRPAEMVAASKGADGATDSLHSKLLEFMTNNARYGTPRS